VILVVAEVGDMKEIELNEKRVKLYSPISTHSLVYWKSNEGFNEISFR